jgi:8-hydroxy-5-deazaflavin:NADPH oxidoreductase
MARVSILGAGNVGGALARRFAAKDLPVGIANRRSPDTLAALSKELGPRIRPLCVEDALDADMIILAIPFAALAEMARDFNWSGKLVIDATNPRAVANIRGRSSTADVAAHVPGAAVVKAFNTLPAAVLAQDPQTPGGRRVLFVSGYDVEATTTVTELIQQLGFAAVDLGNPDEGGRLQQRGGTLFLAQLIREETDTSSPVPVMGPSSATRT